MADVKIKRTTSDAPSSLEYGSLGIANNRLYYGDSNNKPIKTAITGDFADLITAGDNINVTKETDSDKVVIKAEGLIKDVYPGKNELGADILIIKQNGQSYYNAGVVRNSAALVVEAVKHNIVGYGDNGAIFAKTVENNNYSVINKQYLEENAVLRSNIKTIFGQSIVGSGEISAYEAYLKWGGKNISGGYAPIDAAMIPFLGANRLAFMPAAAIDIEYSRDGGVTWNTYTTTDANKINLFCGNESQYYIGSDNSKEIDKSKYMVRFTINSKAANVYTQLRKFTIFVSTGGSTGCYCTVTGRLQSNVESGTETWKTFIDKADIHGDTGWNILNTSIVTYSNNKPSQYGQVRLTFGVTSHAASLNRRGLCILKILGFGGEGWITPSNLASKGSMYTWNYLQDVYFPSSIYASKNKKVALAEQLPTANPSPSGGGTTQLVTLKVNGTTFNISRVTANPSTSTTNTLNKIEIDGVAYNLPSGGSSDVAAYLSSTYLSSYNCSLEREATMWTVTDGSDKYGSFTTRGYIIAGSAGSSSIAGTAIGPNGLYKYNASTYTKMEFKLPNTAGTLVTSEETITYVICSISSLGATGTVTLTNDQLDTIVHNYMRVGIVLNVTGNNSAYGFYFSKKAGTTLYFATPVLDGIYYVAIVTGSTIMNISMKQLMTD